MAASCIPHPNPTSASSSWKVVASAGSQALCFILEALIHPWRPEITDGCDIFCLLIWQDTFSFHTCILLSTHIKDFGEGEMTEMTILEYQVISASYPQLIEPGVFILCKLSQSHSLFLRELNLRIFRDWAILTIRSWSPNFFVVEALSNSGVFLSSGNILKTLTY